MEATMRPGVFALAVVILVGGSVHAHHGYAAFFSPTERTILVEGELEHVLYANPHVVMKIRAADATVYTILWQSRGWVERAANVTKTTFKLGDHLAVIGTPARDPASREVTQVREVRRPRDGWHWRSTAPFVPPAK
jgi:hypothetical protein